MLIREKIYPVRTYNELKLKLQISGYEVPSKQVFDICHPDDWKWEVFCIIMEDCVDIGTQSSEIDRLIIEGIRYCEFDN